MIYLRHHTLSRDICVSVVFYYAPFPFNFLWQANCHDHTSLQSGKRFQRHNDIFVLHNNRMPKKNLVCHLFARTVKCRVDTELFLVKMQKKCQISPTLANWPLAWLAGATQGRLKNSPIFSFPLSSFTKFSPNSSCSAVSRFPEERWLWWAAQQSILKKWKPFFDVSLLKAVV